LAKILTKLIGTFLWPTVYIFEKRILFAHQQF